MRSNSQRGSVTAELVLVLPTVLLVIVLGVGAFSLQLKQLSLVSAASSIAKAIAREESVEEVDLMLTKLSPKVAFEIIEQDDSICVILSEEVVVPGMDFEIFGLTEQQCVANFGR